MTITAISLPVLRGTIWRAVGRKRLFTDGKGVIPGQGRYWLAASGNILFVLKYDITGAPGSKNNHIDLHCLSEDNQWRLQDSQPEHQISIAGTLLAANFALSCAPWVCAASYVTHQAETSFDYALSLFTWDEHERFNPVTTRQYRQLCASTAVKNVAWVAQVTPSGLIASGPNLLRYTGVDWLENSELQIRTVPDDQSLYWFAIGNDLVLKCENTPDRIVGMAQVFDPNTTSSQWLTAPISLYDAQPAQPRLSHYYPTVSNDFVSFNTGLYYRASPPTGSRRCKCRSSRCCRRMPASPRLSIRPRVLWSGCAKTKRWRRIPRFTS
nr:Uncharacterised protein [Raoultella sp. NCTC 9187]